MVSSSVTTPRSGVYYFSQGWKLIGLPGIRRYVFLPLLVNIILMGGAFWWLFTRLDSWIPSLMSHVPEWLQWLNYLLWPMVVISILLVFGYFFSTIANWIAAPFSGLLAAHHEARVAEVCLVPAAGHRPFASLLYPRYRPDRRPRAVVPVQRLDAGDSVLRLPF